MSIGDRVESARKMQSTTEQATRMWMVVLFILFAWLVIVHALTYVVVENLILDRNPDLNTKKMFSHFENPYWDKVVDTIPFVQKWYRGLNLNGVDSTLIRAPATSREPNVVVTEEPSCVDRFFDVLQETIPNTSPVHAELVLQNLGLDKHPVVREALKDLLTEPQPLSSKYNEATQCLSTNEAVTRLACVSKATHQWDTPTEEDVNVLEYLVNQAAVYETLTLVSLDDVAVLNEIVDVMSNTRRHFKEDLIETSYSSINDKNYLIARYRSAVLALEIVAESISEYSVVTENQALLQMGILDGVKVDVEHGLEDNARVGLAISAFVQHRSSFVESTAQKWQLGENWADAYIAWSMTIVWGSLSADYLGPLMIPSVSCSTGDSAYSGDTLMARRTISYSISLLHQFQLPSSAAALIEKEKLVDIGTFFFNQTSPDLQTTRYDTASALGESNINHVAVANPSSDRVEEMLYDLCLERCHDGSWGLTDTVPHSEMDDEQFQVYVGYILWVTCLIGGIGSELLVFLLCFQNDGWSESKDALWKFAQFFFPLLAATTLGMALSHNYLCLPFLVGGLWKFGFPETILFMYMALVGERHRIDRMGDFLNATGTITHHSASALLIVMLLVGVVPPSRYVVGPILILLMQHWFVLFRYVNNNVYIVLELILEFWFEWIVISDYQYIAALHWTASLSAATMLVAHWEYLLAAALDVLKCEVQSSGEELKDDSITPIIVDEEDDDIENSSELRIKFASVRNYITEIESDTEKTSVDGL